MRRYWLLAIGYLLLAPAAVYACLPAPFEPEGTKVERFGESQAFLSWDKGIEYLVIDPQLRGTAKEFGMALAFPAKPEVKEAPKDLFNELAEHTRPRERPVPEGLFGAEPSKSVPPGTVSALPVELIETKEVGEFTVSILTATDAQALLDWLNEHGYTITQQDLENFNYYVAQGGHFFAALKINPHKISAVEETYDLTPIEFSFPNTERPLLPLRLARDQDPPQEFTLYTLADPPLIVYGAQVLYNQENSALAALEHYKPEDKWLTRLQFTIDPSKIETDLWLSFWQLDLQPVHIYEDEEPPVILPEFVQVSAGIVPPPAKARAIASYVSDDFTDAGEIEWEKAGFGLGFFSVFFVYLALALRALAKKYNTRRRWRAWLPVAQWFLLVDIAKKPRWWAWFILVPLLFMVALGVLAPIPEPWPTVFAILMVAAFFFQQLLVALCVIAIAKSHGKSFATLYGLFMGFGQPVGAIMFGMLAWRKAPTPLLPPHSTWRDLFRFFTRISFKDNGQKS